MRRVPVSSGDARDEHYFATASGRIVIVRRTNIKGRVEGPRSLRFQELLICFASLGLRRICWWHHSADLDYVRVLVEPWVGRGGGVQGSALPLLIIQIALHNQLLATATFRLFANILLVALFRDVERLLDQVVVVVADQIKRILLIVIRTRRVRRHGVVLLILQSSKDDTVLILLLFDREKLRVVGPQFTFLY